MKKVSTQWGKTALSCIASAILVFATSFSTSAQSPLVSQTLASNVKTMSHTSDSTATAPTGAAPRSFTKDAKGKINSYTTAAGKTYKVGDVITLGLTQRIDGRYAFIQTCFKMKHQGDSGDLMLTKYAGQQFVIKGMDNSAGFYGGDGNANMYFYIEVKGMFGGLYQINAEPALMQKEIQ